MLVTAELTCNYWTMHRGNCVCFVLPDIVNMCIFACKHACVCACVCACVRVCGDHCIYVYACVDKMR